MEQSRPLPSGNLDSQDNLSHALSYLHLTKNLQSPSEQVLVQVSTSPHSVERGSEKPFTVSMAAASEPGPSSRTCLHLPGTLILFKRP